MGRGHRRILIAILEADVHRPEHGPRVGSAGVFALALLDRGASHRVHAAGDMRYTAAVVPELLLKPQQLDSREPLRKYGNRTTKGSGAGTYKPVFHVVLLHGGAPDFAHPHEKQTAGL